MSRWKATYVRLLIALHRVLPGRAARNARASARLAHTRTGYAVPTLRVPAGLEPGTRRRATEQVLRQLLSDHALPDREQRVLIAITPERNGVEGDQRVFASTRAAFWSERLDDVLDLVASYDDDTSVELQVVAFARFVAHVRQAIRRDAGGRVLSPFSREGTSHGTRAARR